MRIGKDTVIDFVRQHGSEEHLVRAREELPDSIDTEADRALLEGFGVDVAGLLGFAASDRVQGLLRND